MRIKRILVDSSYAAIWRNLMEGISLFVRESRVQWQLHCVVAADFGAALAQKPDGVLSVLPAQERKLLEAMRKARIPAVNMVRDVHPLLPSVVTNNPVVGEQAAEYFLGGGFRHFAFVGVERAWSAVRLAGFRQRLREKGHDVLHDVTVAPSVQEIRGVRSRTATRQLNRWLAGIPRPVAILTASDFVARSVLEACFESGIDVPEQAAILGVDNELEICEFSPVTLSSIPQNFSRIGFEGAKLLEGLMAGRRSPRGQVLVSPREIVVRKSTDVIAVDDPIVAKALQFIHHGSALEGGPLDVKRLLKETGVSRQWLDRRFKSVMGRTASEEIRRMRLVRARLMLVETRLPMKEVARRCGFSQVENFCRFFRNLTGKPPTAFRAERSS